MSFMVRIDSEQIKKALVKMGANPEIVKNGEIILLKDFCYFDDELYNEVVRVGLLEERKWR